MLLVELGADELPATKDATLPIAIWPNWWRPGESKWRNHLGHMLMDPNTFVRPADPGCFRRLDRKQKPDR